MSRFLALLVISCLLVSCRSVGPGSASRRVDVRLLAESTAANAVDWVLPQSGVHVRCESSPIVDASDIAAVDIVALELGKALLVQLTPRGMNALAERQGALVNRRLVLVINDRAIGTVRLDQPAQSGRLVIFVEVPDSDLPALVQSVQRGLS